MARGQLRANLAARQVKRAAHLPRAPVTGPLALAPALAMEPRPCAPLVSPCRPVRRSDCLHVDVTCALSSRLSIMTRGA